MVLKNLELVLEIHLRTIMERISVSKSPHAYFEGQSIEIAFHEVISTVQRSLYYRQYNLTALLVGGYRGTIQNVNTEAIKEGLTKMGLEGYLTNWIVSMQRTRLIQSDRSGSHMTRAASRGTLRVAFSF